MAAEPVAEPLGRLFEGAPRFIERLRATQPNEYLAALLEGAERIVLEMPEEEQVELLNAHPRIGAAPATVSAMSYREQGYERDPGTAQLQERLEHLNDEYERRFGFRFVIFVNGRPRSQIADLMETHLVADRAAELERGLRDVIAIARDRARELEAGQG